MADAAYRRFENLRLFVTGTHTGTSTGLHILNVMLRITILTLISACTLLFSYTHTRAIAGCHFINIAVMVTVTVYAAVPGVCLAPTAIATVSTGRCASCRTRGVVEATSVPLLHTRLCFRLCQLSVLNNGCCCCCH